MKEQIENEIKQLDKALKSKLISVNEYCTIYYNLSQKLKSLK